MFSTILRLSLKSLFNRRYTALLLVFSIALSVALLLGVERLRTESKNSFTNTLSGTDLIVGARGGSIQLLLYSIFHIGNASNNLAWSSYEAIRSHPRVRWTVPLSLGDSHRGYRVLGTNGDYFRHYAYGQDRNLRFTAGRAFNGVFEAVIGAEVAESLDYQVGSQLVLAHGAGRVSLVEHDDKPFTVVGILARTGTPVDRSIHVSLQGIEAIHVDWRQGMPLPGMSIGPEQALQMDLQPRTITAFLVGLDSPISTFKLQRAVNEYSPEPLTAILPGVVLQELWSIMAIAERTLLAVSMFVVLVGLSGLVTVILTSLNERRREMAILRSLGAGPRHIFWLISGETLVLTLIGIGAGLAFLYLLLFFSQGYIEAHYGLIISIGLPAQYELGLLMLVLLLSVLVSMIPAYRAYRYSLADGMNIRI